MPFFFLLTWAVLELLLSLFVGGISHHSNHRPLQHYVQAISILILGLILIHDLKASDSRDTAVPPQDRSVKILFSQSLCLLS